MILADGTDTEKVIDSLKKRGYTYLGSGRNRDTYLSNNKKWVVKVPRNEAGYFNNFSESDVYCSRGFYYINPARCKLLGSLLVMEYVEPINVFKMKDYPRWADCVDGGQVGLSRSGKIVAYDFAIGD